MELYAVIMAGGVGARFWPRSRAKKPKQLLRIFGENTMIQDTVSRLDGLVSKENIYVITNRVQKPRVIEQLPQIPRKNIIDEPFGKNTAACIGLASVIVENMKKDAVILTLAADHLIKDVEGFHKTMKRAAEFAYKSKGLVTIGINPTRPETGYGYIQIDETHFDQDIHKVINFAEKPNLSTAKRFISSGDFLWNSGMFIWRADTILDEIKKHMEDLYEGLEELKQNINAKDFTEVLTRVYGQLKSISIDYGVMEKSDNVYLTKGDFDWSDVGSWETVYQLSEHDDEGNSKIGDVYTLKTSHSYIFSPRKFTAAIGVHNLLVIETEEALLICNRKNSQDVKSIVDSLKINDRKELL
ncbi:MAG: mannose-1-phosphate guanylyltransferase [Ignavibacteria bacterium GWB2_35_6b]|nr:MAG: mannose-1-phosphate guanylyltransferase [Ignavibacteria bacterium GWB2_35_6b]